MDDVKEMIQNDPELQRQNIERFILLGKEGRIPTIKQARVASHLAMGGNKSGAEILRKSDYSETIALNPDRVLQSDGVRKALEIIGLDDVELAKDNRDLLRKSFKIEVTHFPDMPIQKKGESEEEYKERTRGIITDQQIRDLISGNGGILKHLGRGMGGRTAVYTFPDSMARLKALELIYKVKGSFAPTKTESKNLNYNFSPAMLRKEMEKRKIRTIDAEVEEVLNEENSEENI